MMEVGIEGAMACVVGSTIIGIETLVTEIENSGGLWAARLKTASARWSILPLDRALAVVPPQRERNGKYRHGASRSLMRRVGGVSANDMIQKLFQSQNAGTIKIDSMLVGGNLGFDSHSPWHIPGQTDGDGYIIVDRLRDGFGDTHHSEDRHAVAASHERPPRGHDGQIVGQAFQSRVTTGPVDTIE